MYFYYEFKYHRIVLYGRQYVALESSVYKTSVLEFGVITPNVYQDGTLYYRYFIEDTMLYNIHLFMYEGKSMEE